MNAIIDLGSEWLIDTSMIRDWDTPIAQEAHQVAKHQAQHMSRIIDDTLDAFHNARAATRLNLVPVNVATTVKNAIDTARPAIESRGHTLSVSLPDGPTVLLADPSRLQRILTNLLTNAAKYTDPGGQITLTASSSRDVVTICVRDNGRGITSDLLPRIVDLYQRGPNQRESGLGLGLTLVKAMVELHGGSVSACSKGQGVFGNRSHRRP
jgi:signal transduction histidine kinase